MEISERQLLELLCQRESAELAAVYQEYCDTIGEPDVGQKMRACKYLCDRKRFATSVRETVPVGDADGAPDSVRGQVAYTRNSRTDSAFELLREGNKRVREHFVPSMADACECVWDGSCEFCLVPIENSIDGKLYSFYAMLDRYDLRICDTVSVEDGQGTSELIFAVAGRRTLGENRMPSGRPLLLEFSAISEDADFISNTVGAARELGGRVLSIGTQPSPDADDGNKYYFTVEFDGVSPVPMAVYLTLEHVRYSLIGWYPKYKKTK